MIKHSSETTKNTTSISLEIDDKIKFQLEFATRVTNLPLSKFIEIAIKKSVNELSLSKVLQTNDDDNIDLHSEISLVKNWLSYWGNEEGISMVSLLTCELMQDYTSAKDDQISLFILNHWNYFGMDENLENLSQIHCNIIWPHLEKIVDEYLDNNIIDTNYGAKKLSKVLKDNNLEPFPLD